jgi:hypothetical protein
MDDPKNKVPETADAKPGLTPEQQVEIMKRISEKWRGPRECPICGTNKWEMARDVVTPWPMLGMGMGINAAAPTVYPVVQLACENCGFTHSFNLVVLGLLPRVYSPIEPFEGQFPKKGGEDV